MDGSGLEHPSLIGGIFGDFSSENRLVAFNRLAQGDDIATIVEELDVTRSGVQHWIADWRDGNYLEEDSHDLTAYGRAVHGLLTEIDAKCGDLEEEAFAHRLRDTLTESDLSNDDVLRFTIREALRDRAVSRDDAEAIVNEVLDEADRDQE
ncbi:hypothetical protein [Haloterrigena alkaliphila]|uniref:Homeodomain-like domain-containing protein n=1 Tax=Haloterrigena alkaliphila TaxID=2816475 RepID=A0A8A2VKR5_9EURY|nr:hypothetical protein [Haloterrigena alkaliphila]QSX01096.1 hypothetical protein J0X25_09135 [Haloterrigena alkaliphila]